MDVTKDKLTAVNNAKTKSFCEFVDTNGVSPKKRIVLIQPGEKIGFGYKITNLPTSLLPLAGYLMMHGYPVEIFDMRWQDMSELNPNDVLCVGITSLTGLQIGFALTAAKYVREKNPGIPIIWGGIHASLQSEQTAENPYVDIVVKGEGELTLLELAEKLSKNKPIDGVKGIVYKKNNKVISNPDREFMDVNDVPDLPYELLDLNKYEKSYLGVQTSRSCPHRCTFCYHASFDKRSWRAMTPTRVADLLEKIIKKFHPSMIFFIDDNFFVSKERVAEVCRLMIKKGLNSIKYGGNLRIDYFVKYEPEFLNLLRQAGWVNMDFGAESGSQRILNYVQKDLNVDDTPRAFEICRKYGFYPTASFMFGFPTETKSEMLATMKVMDIMKKLDSRAIISSFIFMPYPGTPLFSEAVKYGFKPPASLEEWSRYYWGNVEPLQWLPKKYKSYVRAVGAVAMLTFRKPGKPRPSPIYFLKLPAVLTLLLLARIRWKLKFFELPIELVLSQELYFKKK